MEGSFLLFSESCIDKIGNYHFINETDEVILALLKLFPNVQIKTNLLTSLSDWIFTFNINKVSNFDIFLPLFMKCKQVVSNEYKLRSEHLEHCVCLSNKPHTHRYNNVKKCLDQMEKDFRTTIVSEFIMRNSNMFNDHEMCCYYLECYHYGKIDTNFVDSKLQAFIDSNFAFIIFDENGNYSFSRPNPILDDFIYLKPFHNDIDTKIQSRFRTRLEKLIFSNIRLEDNYERNYNSVFISCVEVDLNNQVTALKVDYDKLSEFFQDKFLIKIDSGLLLSIIESKYLADLYKTCFCGILKYHLSLMYQICQKINTLVIDKDIKEILVSICGSMSGSGGLMNSVLTMNIDKIKTMIHTFPLFRKAYNSYVLSNPPPKGYKTTKIFEQDIARLPFKFIIDFVIWYEKNWKDYVEQHRTVKKVKLTK